MASNRRRPGRNRDGSYDLSEAQHAHPSRGNARRPRRGEPAFDERQMYVEDRRRGRAEHENADRYSHERGHSRTTGRNQRVSRQQADSRRREMHQPAHSPQGSHSRSAMERTAPSRYGSHEGAHSADYARNSSRYHERKRGMSRGKKVALGIVVALVVVLAVGGTAFGLWYGKIMGNLSGDDKNINTLAPVEDGKPYYVLLLGGDSRTGSSEDNRSDSMMVARVDETNKQVSLISIPRDLRVNMGEHGYQKINAAIEFGGYDYAMQIVNQLLGIQINYYAFIYFDGFEQLVDKLGGVTVEVPEGTYYDGVSVPAGDAVEIDGKEALVLARCRHGNPPDQGAYAMGDYQRTLNQRNLIKAIGKKVLASDVTQLPGLIEGLSECVQTNMDVSRIVSLAQNMKGMDMDAMEAEQLPIAGTTETNGAGWCAVLYNDVFEVMRDNFANGRPLLDGLGAFNEEHNDDNVGSDYTDGELYAYTSYEEHFGDFRSSTSDTGSGGSEDVSSAVGSSGE